MIFKNRQRRLILSGNTYPLQHLKRRQRQQVAVLAGREAGVDGVHMQTGVGVWAITIDGPVNAGLGRGPVARRCTLKDDSGGEVDEDKVRFIETPLGLAA